MENAFQDAFIRPGGAIGNESQTSYILPHAYGLVPESLRHSAAQKLAANIVERGTLLTTGFLGTPFSLDALADNGYSELPVYLLLRPDYPGWGYMVANGATTIWERWNSDAGDVSMNSFNHYAFGTVTGFLYRRVAGIAPGKSGFKEFVVRSLLDTRLGAGKAMLLTDYGQIVTAWKFDDQGQAMFDLTVPTGRTATVNLPRSVPTSVGPGTHHFIVGPSKEDI